MAAYRTAANAFSAPRRRCEGMGVVGTSVGMDVADTAGVLERVMRVVEACI